MPDNPLGYLVDYLFDAGPSMPGGFGEAPLTHGEIRAWQDNTGIELMPREVRAIRIASALWVQERAAAVDPARPAPWNGQHASREERSRLADSLRDSFDRMFP
jgi:hypothetical protein